MDELSKNVEKLQHAVEALLDTPQRQSPSEPHPPRARDSNNDEREEFVFSHVDDDTILRELSSWMNQSQSV